MAKTIENVPVKHCLPAPGFVLLRQKEGDIVLIAASGTMAAMPQLKELCALVHKDHISGVIRDYDWRSARRGARA